jgi:hypothetical protein
MTATRIDIAGPACRRPGCGPARRAGSSRVRGLLAAVALTAAIAVIRAPAAGAAEPAAGNDGLDAAAVDAAVDRGTRWLVAAQAPDGSWGSGGFRGSAAVTAQAVMALVAAGSTPSAGRQAAAVRRGVGFLRGCAAPDGLIAGNEQAAHGPMYAHVFATTALAELHGETDDDERTARILRGARDLLVRTQDDSGGWRYKPERGAADLSVTAAAVVALRGLLNGGFEVEAGAVERATAYLEALQNPDGGFRYLDSAGPSGPPRTAAALFALLVAERNGAAIDRGWEWLDAHPIVPGGDGYSLYGLSYEAAARWRRRPDAADPRWSAWYARTAGLLIAAQRDDGAWQDSSCAEYGTAAAVSVLCVPRGTTPLFEAESAEAGR